MSEQAQQTPEPARGGRGLRIALAVSVALNLAVLGLVAGAMIGGGPRGGGPDGQLRALGLGPFAMAFSREDRAELARGIDRAALRAERRALGDSLATLRQSLLADPFDRAAAEAALGRSRGAAEALQAIGHGAIVERIAQMDAAERAALAGRLERALRRAAGRDTDR